MGIEPGRQRGCPTARSSRGTSGGQGNCFEGNQTQSKSTPSSLPKCPGSPVYAPADLAVVAPQVPCTAWDPNTNPRPSGCDWFDTPPKP